MDSDVERESLRWFDRGSLEGLQMRSKYLRDLVKRYSPTLPLRRIFSVIVFNGSVRIGLLEQVTSIALPASEPNLEELFNRVTNAFIVRLTVSFDYPQNRPFLFYLRTNADRMRCRVLVIIPETTYEPVDYDMLDFLGHSLRPRVYEASLYSETRGEYATLFSRDAMRGSVSRVVFTVSEPAALTLATAALLRSGAPRKCNATIYGDPRPWITRFIEAFERVTLGTETVRDVALLYVRREWDPPTEHAGNLLASTPGIDAPVPDCAFVEGWCRNSHVSSATVAKRYTFENIEAKKTLKVHVWTVEYVGVAYAYFLEVIDS